MFEEKLCFMQHPFQNNLRTYGSLCFAYLGMVSEARGINISVSKVCLKKVQSVYAVRLTYYAFGIYFQTLAMNMPCKVVAWA